MAGNGSRSNLRLRTSRAAVTREGRTKAEARQRTKTTRGKAKSAPSKRSQEATWMGPEQPTACKPGRNLAQNCNAAAASCLGSQRPVSGKEVRRATDTEKQDTAESQQAVCRKMKQCCGWGCRLRTKLPPQPPLPPMSQCEKWKKHWGHY